MPIIGLNLKSIKANIDQKKVMDGNINISSTPHLINVEKRDINIPEIKDIVGIDFKFETFYEIGKEGEKKDKNERIGEILFEGEVLYQTNKVKDVLNKWKKEKKLEDGIAAEILNAIFRKCMTKAVDIASELRLPPPLQFPNFKIREQSEYIG